MMQKRHIHPSITILSVYLTIIIIASIMAGTIIPIIINYVSGTISTIIEWTKVAQSTYAVGGIHGFGLHPYIEHSIVFLFDTANIDHTLAFIRDNAGNIQSVITSQLSSLTSGSVSMLSSVGGVFFNWLLIAIMTFSMALERVRIGQFVLDIMPDSIESYLVSHYRNIQDALNAWIRAMLILSCSIFAITYISLTLLELVFSFDTNQTFTLALIGGVMEFVPYIGPILALVPAFIIGAGISWQVALAIAILYIVIQQIENNILVPYVMSRSLDLSPFLVFVVMMSGAILGGILGIILAVPVAAICRIFYLSYHTHRPRSYEIKPRSK
jgi:predicted PurR-regulated permease PerM